MNIAHLKATYEVLLNYMADAGYSKNYISLVKNSIDYILDKPDNSWISYDDVCSDYIGDKQAWEAVKRKSLINLIANYDLKGQFPDREVHSVVFQKDTQLELCEDFQQIMDSYSSFCKAARYGKTTIESRMYAGKAFFNRLQKTGCFHFEDITEDDVLNSLRKENGTIFTHRYCMFIREIFDHCDLKDNSSVQKIRSYIPWIPCGRKNIQYLTETEVSDITNAIDSEESGLTLRDKAVGCLLLYTGLRRSDIAGLTLSSIDWNAEILDIVQQKTGVHVRIPLLPKVGNAIYEYLKEERPATESPFLFMTLRYPFRKISAKGVAHISDRIYDAANVRKSKGDRRGTHIFRHRIVSRMLECDVPQPVISESLGHSSPRAIDDYLNLDFHHLKECSLSVDRFPTSEEVFGNEGV
ncbi:MAG: tyrosine-type recombinase/integrase [Blautia sp.]|nr:tyrosine-type recombinase/integrase [Blautia sp.]